jgi:hypothetical protein
MQLSLISTRSSRASALFALRSVQATFQILRGERETIIAAHEGEALINDKTLFRE